MRIAMVLAGLLTVLAGNVEAMPAHPDLIARLGPERVAAMQLGSLDPRLGYESLAAPLLRARGQRTPPVSGVGTCLFILWDWADRPANREAHPNAAYADLFFSLATHPTGSMNDYYIATSFGRFHVVGDVVGWNTALLSYASYARPDGSQDFETCRQMLRDAITELDATVDFSQWDNDGPDGVPHSGDDDGLVDALFFLHAGAGQEASGDTHDIWSHASMFWDLPTNDGVAIGRYSVEPEAMPDGSLTTVGVYCHEYGHVLGLPDLYDTDYTTSGLGEWCLMSSGSWNNRAGEPAGSCPALMSAWCKAQLGWVTPTTLTTSMPIVTLPPAASLPVAYRVFRQGESDGGEYFLLENRQPIGFDAGLVRRQVALGLPQPQGMVIYHVDEAVAGNSTDRRRLVDVEDASPWFMESGLIRENLDGPPTAAERPYVWGYNRGDNGDVWPGYTAYTEEKTDWVGPRDRNRFADDTIPSARDSHCEPTGVEIRDIEAVGDLAACRVVLQPPVSEVVPVSAPRAWDFEDALSDDWRGCNGYAHHDRGLVGNCSGTGGIWFGTDGWEGCGGIGYGNSWSDALTTSVLVGIATGPALTIKHRYEVEEGYDFVVAEVRPTGGATWTTLAALTGYVSCHEDTWPIPADVLAAGRIGDSDNAVIDIRLRLVSDEGWSAEDGLECGIGWWVDRVAISGGVVAVPDIPAVGAAEVFLAPAVPNPFNPTTSLRVHVPTSAATATLRVFDAGGRAVRTLLVGSVSPGWQEFIWDGRDDGGARVASGLYIARFTAAGQVVAQKLALIK